MTIRSMLIAIPFLFFGWLLTLLLVTVLTDETPAYMVIFPEKDFVDALPDDVSVVAASSISVTLTSDRWAFARSLYSQGARIVLPAGLHGCLPLSAFGEAGNSVLDQPST
jgi:hypothetical protein